MEPHTAFTTGMPLACFLSALWRRVKGQNGSDVADNPCDRAWRRELAWHPAWHKRSDEEKVRE